MSFWDFTRGAASARLLVDFGLERGVPLARLLAGTRLSRPQLDDPEVQITATQELKLIDNLLKALQYEPGVGLEVGLRYSFSTYGMWGFGLVSSATVGDALALALRFIPLTFAFSLISCQQDEQQCVLSFGEPEIEQRVRRFLIERDMAAAARLMRETVGTGHELSRFTLRERQWPAPDRLARLTAVSGLRPQYGAAANTLAFDSRLLAQRLPQANPVTVAMCEQACAQLMERRRARLGTVELVRQYLAAAPLDAAPDLAQVARMLHLSERTLKRRLQEEQTGFREMLAESRGQRARELLADESLNLTDIAEQMGFGDLSGFSQAFKRWFGVAPSVVRRIRHPDP